MRDLSSRLVRLSPRRLLAISFACFTGSAALIACQSGEGDLFVAPLDAGATATDATADGDTTGGGDGGEVGDGGVVNVQVLAFNDFHGNLRPPSPSNAAVLAKMGDPAVTSAGNPVLTDAGVTDGGALNESISAGGAAYLAAHINALRAKNPNTLVVSAGDLVGASPLVSSSYYDEPTIEVMNTLKLDVSSVGNHEFDHGPANLLRLQYGGCDFTTDTDSGAAGEIGSCTADKTFPGGSFEYLAANVEVGDSGKTLFPPYTIKTVAGAKIAFIGMTLAGTPTIVSPTGVAGLAFEDEIATTNALVPILTAQGVDAIIVLVHQGGFQNGTYNDCEGLSGAILPIAMGLDPKVAAIASAHTHVAYNCMVNGRPLTQAASYGRVLTQFNLSVDTATHQVKSITANNIAVTRDVTPDPTVEAVIDRYVADIAPIAERQVGSITADITKNTGPNGESPLGDVIADGMLAAGGAGTDLALINIGGVRDSLLFAHYYTEPDGDVTYEKAESVLPFSDNLISATCKGSDIIAAVQQNEFVEGGGLTKVLQVSAGFTYSWSTSAAADGGVGAADPSSFKVNNVALDPSGLYNIVTVDFLQEGGDGYTALENCTVTGHLGVDLVGFDAYLGAHPNLAPPMPNRITKVN